VGTIPSPVLSVDQYEEAKRKLPMLDHISIGVHDLKRSQEFYDAVLGTLGYKRLNSDEGSLGYGDDSVGLWLYPTEHPVSRNKKSGLHFSFTASSQQRVNKFHAAALESGGDDNGEPGLRKDYGPHYYAAYVIDPDGYRLEAHCDTGS
jgi:catechol 2,3-dioxygenase-like lactoylglutathione lyase family enzyme